MLQSMQNAINAMSTKTTSIGITNWAGTRARIVWSTGEGDNQLTGWERGDGQRAIETNGDPVWEGEEGFADAWREGDGSAFRKYRVIPAFFMVPAEIDEAAAYDLVGEMMHAARGAAAGAVVYMDEGKSDGFVTIAPDEEDPHSMADDRIDWPA